jgi:hypothetical protein
MAPDFPAARRTRDLEESGRICHPALATATVQLEPGHCPPATTPPARLAMHEPQRAEAPAAFRIPASRTQLRHPGPLRSVTSTRTTPFLILTATVTVSPGSTRAAVPDRITEGLAGQHTATSPHGCPGPSTSETNARAARARSARPASVTASRTAALAITAPPFPARTGREVSGPPGGRTRGCTLDSAARVKPSTGHLRGSRPWLVRRRGPRPWPSVQSRRSLAPLHGPDFRPLCVRGHHNMTVYSATR